MPLPLIAAGAGAAAQMANAQQQQLIDIGMGLTGFFGDINQAGISRDDQRYYTENAHSVEVADLKRAGLNPILSANHGAAVPTPVTSQPGGQLSAAGSNAASRLSNIVPMLKDLAISAAQVDDIQAGAELKRAQAGMIPSQIKSLESGAGASDAMAALNRAYAGKIPYEVQNLIANVGATRAMTLLYGKQGKVADATAANLGADTALKGQEFGFRAENNPLQLVLNKVMARVRESEVLSNISSARSHDASAQYSRMKAEETRRRGGYEGWPGNLKAFGSYVDDLMGGTVNNPGSPPFGQSSAASGAW